MEFPGRGARGGAGRGPCDPGRLAPREWPQHAGGPARVSRLEGPRVTGVETVWRRALPGGVHMAAPADVVIVAIDDASFRELQLQWPWPRAVHADLVDALAEMGASVIAFDVLFLEPSRFGPEDDARLAEAAARAGNVIFGHKLTHIVDQQFRTSALDKPVPPLAEAAWSLGLVNHPPDPDRFGQRRD